MTRTEARILHDQAVLLWLSEPTSPTKSAVEDFCGQQLTLEELSDPARILRAKQVYLCGDLARAAAIERELEQAAHVFVIRELSQGEGPWPRVEVGRLPQLVHGVGLMYRRFFDPQLDYFAQLQTTHRFQTLTESNKPGTAHRTGIYLTPVERVGEELRFRLLRCSSNFSGPTEDFSSLDHSIVDALNEEAAAMFEHAAPLNHVLAQIYWNTPASETRKQTKAKIKGHADKTKDMPASGIMAFCSFYGGLEQLQPSAKDPFDLVYGRSSGLTKLQFRLKPSVAERPGCTLTPRFEVTLYPNSAFFMPLSTNRLYTHEIRPSQLDAARLPTRLGYVVRCSARPAVFAGGRTLLEHEGARVELEPPTPEGMAELRKLYAEENRTDAFINYGDEFSFSMNAGDYSEPTCSE